MQVDDGGVSDGNESLAEAKRKVHNSNEWWEFVKGCGLGLVQGRGFTITRYHSESPFAVVKDVFFPFATTSLRLVVSRER